MRRLLFFLFISSFICVLHGCIKKPKKNNTSLPQNDSMLVVKSTLLSPNEFESKMASMPNTQLIDVRTPGEFNNGFIKNAINIDYQGNSFATEIEKLDKSKPTFVYCQSGGRSSESCLYMGNHGFKVLYELKNGFGAWTNAKKPVELINQNK